MLHSRKINSLLLILAFLFSPLLANPSDAQQRSDQNRLFSVSSGDDPGRFHHVDELGIRLATGWLYHSSLDIETYRLNPGDLLSITLEGNVSGTIRGLRVNSQGSVVIPEAGVISVANMLFSEAQERIAGKMAEIFPDTRATLTLEQPRTIQVHVVGNIPFSGPQLVFAQTRLDQAVYRAFFQVKVPQMQEPVDRDIDDPVEVSDIDRALAPTGMLDNRYPQEFLQQNRFALRNILINRADGSKVTADLIHYLKTGALESNPMVKQGDIISITRFHEYNPRVSISGAVHESIELEYREDDTIDRLVQIAGGTTFDAAEDLVKVLRLHDQQVQELHLTSPEEIASFSLSPNDRVIIPYDRDKRTTQSVEVYGEALLTGRFPIKEGTTTLYDLLGMAGGLTERALVQSAYISRSRPGKTEYGKDDELSQTETKSHVLLPNSRFGFRPSFNDSRLLRTSDQFLKDFDYLSIEHKLIRDHVPVDLLNDDQMREILLFDGDRLHIPRDDGTIFVFGQVNNPGYYTFREGMSVSDYINNAGNFALAAMEDRVFIIKSGTYSWHKADQTTLESGDLIFVDRTPYDELQFSREYELRQQELRNSRIQLVLAGIATVASVITTYIAVTR